MHVSYHTVYRHTAAGPAGRISERHNSNGRTVRDKKHYTAGMDAGRTKGLRSVLTAIVFTGNYSGQTRAKVGDRMYAIYRTYDRDDETTELYLQYETGVNNG